MERTTRKTISEYRVSNGCSQVTVVWMRSEKTSASLFHLIAGSLNEPVDGTQDECNKISTHSVFNDLLYQFITEECEESLGSLRDSKKDALLKHNPKFIVTKSLPEYILEDESDDEDEEEGSYRCDPADIMSPIEQEPAAGRGYHFQYSDVMVTIDEPQSPSPTRYFNSQQFERFMSPPKVCHFTHSGCLTSLCIMVK